MSVRVTRLAVGCAVALLLAAPAGAERDQDRARRAVERGEALPLADLLARIGPALGGELVGVQFERHGGRWFYELRVVAANGQMREVHVDAMTADVLSREKR